MLVQGKIADFTRAWWDAKPYRPDGIVASEDTWNILTEEIRVESVPYPWVGVNDLNLWFP
jgi:twinkle protein